MLNQSKQDNLGDAFKINREIRKQTEEGKKLVDEYNTKVKNLQDMRKEQIRLAEDQEQQHLRSIRNQIRFSYEREDL